MLQIEEFTEKINEINKSSFNSNDEIIAEEYSLYLDLIAQNNDPKVCLYTVAERLKE